MFVCNFAKLTHSSLAHFLILVFSPITSITTSHRRYNGNNGVWHVYRYTYTHTHKTASMHTNIKHFLKLIPHKIFKDCSKTITKIYCTELVLSTKTNRTLEIHHLSPSAHLMFS